MGRSVIITRKAGATSQILQVFISDSTSTTGAGKTGLLFNTSGLTAYYHRDTDTTATSITLVTMTVGTYTSGGFKEIDSTNMPGWYQFCPPNAALAAGAESCAFQLQGAAGMAPQPIDVDLHAQVDVTGWLGTAVTAATAGIPDVNVKNINNVAAATPGASGGLLISGANSGTTTLGALTCTGTFTISDGLVVTRSTSNASAISATGNGTGHGADFESGSGATGNGVNLKSNATSGHGARSVGNGTGAGYSGAGGASGPALSLLGFTNGVEITGNSGHGMLVSGQGNTKAGISVTGAPAVGGIPGGPGMLITGGAASTAVSGTSGAGLSITGGAGAASNNGASAGVVIAAGGTTTVSGNDGFKISGTGGGNGLTLTQPGSGVDLNATTTNLIIASVAGSVGSVTGAVGSVTGGVTVSTNSDKTGYSLSSGGIDAILDQSAGIETNITPRQGFRLMLAALAGKLSGAATTSVTIRDTNDAKNRISATVDANGNRTAVTYDLT